MDDDAEDPLLALLPLDADASLFALLPLEPDFAECALAEPPEAPLPDELLELLLPFLLRSVSSAFSAGCAAPAALKPLLPEAELLEPGLDEPLETELPAALDLPLRSLPAADEPLLPDAPECDPPCEPAAELLWDLAAEPWPDFSSLGGPFATAGAGAPLAAGPLLRATACGLLGWCSSACGETIAPSACVWTASLSGEECIPFSATAVSV